jgi:hypothetical protein
VSHKLKIKRVYEKPEPGDGTRILVDRLWPRGLQQSESEAGSLVKRNRAEHRAAKMVWTRCKEVAQLSRAV